MKINKLSWTVSAVIAAGLTATPAFAQTIFANDLDGGGTGALFTTAVGQAPTLDDVRFDFDYGNIDIFGDGTLTGALPSAPNSTGGSTTGLFMSVNNDSLNPLAGDGNEDVVAAFLNGVNVGNGTANPNYVFRFDAWHNSGSGIGGAMTGTTNYALAGINYGANAIQTEEVNDGAAGQGMALAQNADGRAGEDWVALYEGAFYTSRPNGGLVTAGQRVGGPNAITGFVSETIAIINGDMAPGESDFSAGEASGAAGCVIQYHCDAFPIITGAPTLSLGEDNDVNLRAGIPYNRWTTHEISWVNGVFTYEIDDNVIVQRTFDDLDQDGDGTDISQSGTVMLGFWDRFATSIASSPEGANFVVYDNLEIEVLNTVPSPPTPTDLFNDGYLDNLVGDSDNDGDVDLDDFNNLAANFGAATTAGNAVGNFDGDRDVDLDDFNLLAANFGATGGPIVDTVGELPEPASIALLGLGGLAVLRRSGH